MPAHSGTVLTLLDRSAVVFCEPVQLTWSGGTPPYFVSAVSNGGATTYETFASNTTDLSYRWVVDFVAGSDLYVPLYSTLRSPVLTLMQ